MKTNLKTKLRIGLVAISACIGFQTNHAVAQNTPVQETALKQGEKAPDFILMDQNGKPSSLVKCRKKESGDLFLSKR